MATLIAGRFSQQTEAENASAELLRSGFLPQEMSLFYVNTQGQHDLHPVGGDEDESAGTHHASAGAVVGAAGGVGIGSLLGVVSLPVLGPAGPLLGAAVGAYAGSLVGALNRMDKAEEQSEVDASPVAEPNAQLRKAGVLLAVAVGTPAQREQAIHILSRSALEVEETEGDLHQGHWVDFDPRVPINTIGISKSDK